MARISGIRRLFRLPGRSAARIRDDVDDELRFHIEARAAEYVAAGMSPEAAQAEARRAFGDLEYTRRYCREQDTRGERSERRAEWAGDLLHDARYAVRALRRAPGFAIVATLTLALGIGANAAIFSVVNRLLIHPLPFRDADRLVQVWRADAKNSFLMSPMRDAALAWQRQARASLDGAELYTNDEVTLAGEPEAEVVRAMRVSTTYASFLGVRPLAGRGFVAEDTAAGAPDVVLLGESLWRRRFGASSEILGRTVRLAGKPHTVVGVMPRVLEHSLGAGDAPALWVPFRDVTAAPKPGESHTAHTVARLKPGVTVEQARRELATIAARVDTASKRSAFGSSLGVSVIRPVELIGGPVRTALLVMLGAVGFVLLIACANVANLLLARATAREREIAVRAALGAGRGRLVRQLLAESLVLAVVGGVAGLVLATWGLEAIVSLRPEQLDELDGVQLDPLVLGLSALLSLATGVLFGLMPALHATRPSVGESLKAGTRSATSAAAGRRFRSALVAAEVALSLVLLAGAGLLVRSVLGLQQIDPGFQTAGLVTANIQLPRPRYAAGEAFRPFYDQIAERAARLPGVEGVAVASGVPPRMGISFGQLEVEGGGAEATRAAAGDGPMVSINWVGPEYFRLLRIPTRAGRQFAPDEMAVGAKNEVAVINESMARRYWPGADAIGKRFRIGDRGSWTTVVGVVGDVKAGGLIGDHVGNRQIYKPAAEASWPDRTLVLRVAGDDPAAVVPALKQLVRSIDPDVPLREVATVSSLMAESISRPRFNMMLLAAFALLALVLAAVGLYGVIAYSVGQRTREIGVRMALGARPGSVQRLVVFEGMRPALAGVVVGLALALALGRVLAGLLHGVSPRDPATLAAVTLLLIAVALLACLLPARRAARVDPMEAIRNE